MMSTFYYTILKAINDYKALLRKNFTTAQANKKIKSFGIKRKQLKAASEQMLYEIGTKIVADLTEYTSDATRERATNNYYGAAEFLAHFKRILSENKIENHQIVNHRHKASRALVASIQLMSLPENQLTKEVAKKIDYYGQIVAKYGSAEQIKIFNDGLRQHQPRHVNFFVSILENFSIQLNQV